ncbi:MAG: hypothetical protein ACI87H_002331, partial [Gammaproteobacteria bacterium]
PQEFDKIVRNDFGRPKDGPQGETQGCVSQSLRGRSRTSCAPRHSCILHIAQYKRTHRKVGFFMDV